MECPPTDMRTLWRAIVRVVFWSYERGTWQYDIAVAGIVLFVLFSPRLIRYSDQPPVGPPASPIQTPELEHDLHETVQKNVQDLRQGGFEILRIEPIRGDNGTVAYYDVSIKP